MKTFNTTAVCVPSKHYMVDISEKVTEIKKMVDTGKYFTINRARQYGKTTTLTALKRVLTQDYTVLSLDFQKISNAGFATEEKFVQEFSRLLWNKQKSVNGFPDKLLVTLEIWKDSEKPSQKKIS